MPCGAPYSLRCVQHASLDSLHLDKCCIGIALNEMRKTIKQTFYVEATGNDVYQKEFISNWLENAVFRNVNVLHEMN